MKKTGIVDSGLGFLRAGGGYFNDIIRFVLFSLQVSGMGCLRIWENVSKAGCRFSWHEAFFDPVLPEWMLPLFDTIVAKRIAFLLVRWVVKS